MEPIQSSLQRWINNNKSFKQRQQAMKREILQHPDIAQFLREHPEITQQHIEKRLNKLYEYTTQSIQCANCQNVTTCRNIVKGYSPILTFTNGEIHLAYEKCRNQIQREKVVAKQKLIRSVYMPQEILNARMADLYLDPHRVDAMKSADQFINEAKEGLPPKGIFLTGPFGVGKTFFLGAIANELQQLNISSMLIYMPEFVREMREAISDNTVQEKINVFKQADVLMLDDIGAETLSAWFRDEVLGSILQYRMMERLPVFFTSNYTMEQLEQILATTTRNGVEQVKAGRIMERIREVSTEVELQGENRRTLNE